MTADSPHGPRASGGTAARAPPRASQAAAQAALEDEPPTAAVPHTVLSSNPTPAAIGGVKAMDISDYASRTYDLQQQQHALLTATGQVSAVCDRCVSSDDNAILSGRFGL